MFLLVLWKSGFSCQHAGTLWLGCMWYGLGSETQRPKKAMDGSHHHWVSFRSFNIHTCTLASPLMNLFVCLEQSGKEIRPQFVAMVVCCSGNSWGRIWKWVQFHWVIGANTMIIMYFCMLLAYNQLVFFPSSPFQPQVASFCLLAGCCLFISHCFQAWTALFWVVPYVSAECRWMAPARLQAPPETFTVTRTFFFLPPLVEAFGVMKTKYTHLPRAVCLLSNSHFLFS